MRKQKDRKRTAPLYFSPVPLADIVHGSGKHSKILFEIFSDLQMLDDHSALKIDLAEVGEKKADLRAALHRAAKRKNVLLATASDQQHLYVFRARKPRPAMG